MPGNTAHSYPYPLGTDRVMDGDDSIKNLANAIETKCAASASGTAVTPACIALNTPVSVSITFPAGRFLSAPRVQVCSTGSSAPWSVGVNGITTGGCTLIAAKVYGGNSAVTLQWVATDV
jgi:hypothetical protein